MIGVKRSPYPRTFRADDTVRDAERYELNSGIETDDGDLRLHVSDKEDIVGDGWRFGGFMNGFLSWVFK